MPSLLPAPLAQAQILGQVHRGVSGIGSDCQHGPLPPNPVQRSGEGHRKGLCKEIEAREALLFSWGLHSLLNSHQSWEEAGQGLEDLLTVVASSPHPVPKPSLGGGRKRMKREIQGLRAKPPPIFIAGELEICLSLPTLGRWTLRGPTQEEVTLDAPTPLMAMSGLSWATSGPWRPKGQPCLSRAITTTPPKQGPQAQVWAQWSLEVGSECTRYQAEISTGRKGEF